MLWVVNSVGQARRKRIQHYHTKTHLLLCTGHDVLRGTSEGGVVCLILFFVSFSGCYLLLVLHHVDLQPRKASNDYLTEGCGPVVICLSVASTPLSIRLFHCQAPAGAPSRIETQIAAALAAAKTITLLASQIYEKYTKDSFVNMVK